MRRIYTHNDETANGKAFCAFLALIVYSEMKNCLSEFIREGNYTFCKIICELNKVKVAVDPYDKYEKLNPASKTVNSVFDLLCIS